LPRFRTFLALNLRVPDILSPSAIVAMSETALDSRVLWLPKAGLEPPESPLRPWDLAPLTHFSRAAYLVVTTSRPQFWQISCGKDDDNGRSGTPHCSHRSRAVSLWFENDFVL
jgi:hypothetical protein